MIEFVTLFLGLYHGLQPVELEITPFQGHDVAEVELWLDGELNHTLSGPPWRSSVDLGPELTPHELIAVARDAEGDELGRARRWINREAFADSKRLDEETAVVLSLDSGIQLPSVPEMQTWFSIDGEALEVLRAETGPADLIIVRDPEVQRDLERTASIFFQFWLGWKPEDPLDKEAMVADAQKELLQRGLTAKAVRGRGNLGTMEPSVQLRRRCRHPFHLATGAPASRISRRQGVFMLTDSRPSLSQGLLSHSAVVRPLHFHPRLADAVAMAGLEAHTGQRRRAVPTDHGRRGDGGPSRYTPAAVRSYLEDLQVPLWIWTFGHTALEEPSTPEAGAGARAWGGLHSPRVDPVATGDESIGHLKLITGKIRRALQHQRIVWLRGAHPPHRVDLSEQAEGVHLAGTTPEIQKRKARR